jgi:hypothetical protein
LNPGIAKKKKKKKGKKHPYFMCHQERNVLLIKLKYAISYEINNIIRDVITNTVLHARNMPFPIPKDKLLERTYCATFPHLGSHPRANSLLCFPSKTG